MKIWEDLRHRRNLDIYLTVVAAAAAAILSFFGLLSVNQLPAAVLAVLAVVAFSSLATRDAVASFGVAQHLPFQTTFPDDLVERRNRSQDTLLIGVSLSRTIETSYNAFERVLRGGGHLRILLTDPDASDTALDARCQASWPDAQELREEVQRSLRMLDRLRANGGPGQLEVRLTDVALKYGANFVDIASPGELICIQLYSFRYGGESCPIFTLTPREVEWFSFYREQSESLWRHSKEHRWPDPPSSPPSPPAAAGQTTP